MSGVTDTRVGQGVGTIADLHADTPEDRRAFEDELTVIRLIAEGMKDHAIARRLEISVVTVRRRAQRFRERVGAKNRSHALAIAAVRGLLNGELGNGSSP